jgi:hypothetical protein
MDVIVSATRILVRSCEEEAEVMTRNRTIIRGVRSARKLGTALASVDADSCIAALDPWRCRNPRMLLWLSVKKIGIAVFIHICAIC